MTTFFGLSKDEQEIAWRNLEAALPCLDLLDGKGSRRRADVEEFMLMHGEYCVMPMHNRSAKWYAFKHRVSRNYLFVNEIGEAYVPVTTESFMKGEFPEAL